MEYRLSDILNIPAIQSLMESFYALTSIPFGLLDLDGNILAGIGWQRLCTEFHRANPASAARCLHSDRQIAERVKRAAPGETVMYTCENGLLETVLPVMIQGEHCGSFILGQFLFEPPDDSFFRAQARDLGFDENAYMKAVREIPIFSRKQIDAAMQFYAKLVNMMAMCGLKNLHLLNAQEEILDKESRFELVVQGTSDGIWDWDLRTGQVYFSRRWKKIIGYSDDEISNNAFEWKDRIHPDDLERVTEANQEVIDGRTPVLNVEYRLRHRDGSYRHILARGACLRDTDGTPVRMAGSHTDITEHKSMERRLRRMASIVDQAREGILLALPDGTITYANAMSEEIISDEYQPLLDQTLWSVLEHSSVATHLQILRERLEQGNSWQGRIRSRPERVPALVVEASMFPIKDDEGNVTSLACIFKDISETIALEARLTQTQKMEAIGTLAGGIAHDFNNILSAILGFTHLSLADKTMNRRVRARLQKTAQAAERAGDLVQQILNFSRSDPNVRAPVSMRSIIVETLRLLRASLPVTITLEKKLRTDGLVMGDHSRLHQMLMNLCTNAGQAMSGIGGSITVELEETRAKPAAFGFSGPAVTIRVSDTGQGMEPEVVKQIFTPFFTTRGVGQGTGLGLSLVHSIVADHGGTVQVTSTPGKGSTFSIHLPAHIPTHEQTARQEAPVVEALPGGTEHILVVDDEPMVAEIITDGLKQLGYRITSHIDPQEAVQAFGRKPGEFDLIISDLTMPTMSGVDLFKAVRSIRRDIPFILCTGYALDNAVQDLDMARFSAVIPKPVSSMVLATAVRNCLD